MALDYFYDASMRRILIQIARIFIGFKYAYTGTDGNTLYQTVPCVYAATNSQVQSIINNNSENTLSTIPIFALYLSDIKQSHRRRQDPTYVNRANVTEREIVNGEYTDKPGNKYTVEMLMPVMYDLTVKVDLITSNESQKWQILEQILVLFNPEVELQTSTNAVDWTALTTITLTDINITPAANNSTINDMTTLTFNIPIYISPPAKVKRSDIIREIIMNVSSTDVIDKTDDMDIPGDNIGQTIHNLIVTPEMAYLNVERVYTNKNVYSINLCSDSDNTPLDISWDKFFSQYGNYKDGSSLIYLLQDITSVDNNKNFYIGRLSNSNEENKLILTIDPNTLPHSYYPDNVFSGIIDPKITTPIDITDIQVGDAYLLLDDIPQNSKAWGTIYNGKVANKDYGAIKDDIIEWDGSKWNIKFSSTDNKGTTTYYTNKNNGDYITYDKQVWRMSIDATYAPGYWRIDL